MQTAQYTDPTARYKLRLADWALVLLAFVVISLLFGVLSILMEFDLPFVVLRVVTPPGMLMGLATSFILALVMSRDKVSHHMRHNYRKSISMPWPEDE